MNSFEEMYYDSKFYNNEKYLKNARKTRRVKKIGRWSRLIKLGTTRKTQRCLANSSLNNHKNRGEITDYVIPGIKQKKCSGVVCHCCSMGIKKTNLPNLWWI